MMKRTLLWLLLLASGAGLVAVLHRLAADWERVSGAAVSLPGTDRPPPAAATGPAKARADIIQVPAGPRRAAPASPRTAKPDAVAAVQAAPGEPARLVISSLGVDAPVERKGVNAAGQMAVPASLSRLGWYGAGPVPGEPGNAVIAGHVNFGRLSRPGVFNRLEAVAPGAKIEVWDRSGARKVFRVAAVSHYDRDFPGDAVFTSLDETPRLVLVTCEGDWLSAEDTYSGRLVVWAELAE